MSGPILGDDLKPILGSLESPIYALMRVVIGFLFFCHGAQKVFGLFGGQHMQGLPFAAGVIEITCGILVAIGLLGSLAAFIASGEMAVAYFMAHAGGGALPIINHGEPAVMYCFVFLYIAAHGSGKFSVDGAMGK